MHTPLYTLAKMAVPTGAGWMIYVETTNEILKLLSLAVPIVLSIIAFMRDQRKKNGKN